jgi:hypothetical protein
MYAQRTTYTQDIVCTKDNICKTDNVYTQDNICTKDNVLLSSSSRSSSPSLNSRVLQFRRFHITAIFTVSVSFFVGGRGCYFLIFSAFYGHHSSSGPHRLLRSWRLSIPLPRAI